MRNWLAGAAALALMLLPRIAVARDIPAGGFTLNDVVVWLQGKGYTAQLTTGSDGKTHVSTSVGGTNFGVYMFDCKDDRCGSIQFSAGWATHGKFDITRMNEWNRDNRWARGYFDKDNDPWLELDVDLTPGDTYELLDDELSTWRSLIPRFTTLYGIS